MGGVVFGGRDPVILFLLQDKKMGGAKVNTSFIKIIINLNKAKEKVKTFWEVIFFFARNF